MARRSQPKSTSANRSELPKVVFWLTQSLLIFPVVAVFAFGVPFTSYNGFLVARESGLFQEFIDLLVFWLLPTGVAFSARFNRLWLLPLYGLFCLALFGYMLSWDEGLTLVQQFGQLLVLLVVLAGGLLSLAADHLRALVESSGRRAVYRNRKDVEFLVKVGRADRHTSKPATMILKNIADDGFTLCGFYFDIADNLGIHEVDHVDPPYHRRRR